MGIYKALFNLAKEHGMKRMEWVDEESVECGDKAFDWLNDNACEGCQLEWYSGGVWAIPDDYSMTEGCSVSPFGDYV
jgi:hypothetical protein